MRFLLAPWTVALAAALPVLGSSEPARTQDKEKLAQLLEQFRRGDQPAYTRLTELGAAAIEPLSKLMLDNSVEVIPRFQAANVLGDIGKPECVPPLLKALADPYYNLRRCAALALGKCRDERAREPLEKLAREDPFEWKDPDTGEVLYLVRDDARAALAILDGADPNLAGLIREPETFLDDAAKLPALRVERPSRKLPWPFAGGIAEQHIYNNYQQATDSYVHGGLDLLQDVGTEVRAVDDGWVVLIDTNYREWKTHYFMIVAAAKDGQEGWSYTHMDPDTYTVELGDRVRAGQVLGKVVDFSVGESDGVDHLHLGWERFVRKKDGSFDLIRAFDPLLCFDAIDRVAPVVHGLRMLKAGTLGGFESDEKSRPVVSGSVDVLALVSDAAHMDHVANWGVPVMTIEIRGKDSAPWRKLVSDLRGPIGEVRAAASLFVGFEARKPFVAGLPANPVVHAVIATHTDGDGLLERADALHHWDTLAVDANGRARFADGRYEVIVRAWDLAGHVGSATAEVVVLNAQ